MKKLLLIILVFALSVSLVGVAMAAGPKPPKTICFTWSTYTMVLVTRPSGAAIRMADGNMKFHSVNGELFREGSTALSFPVYGSGHISGGAFHFHLSGGGVEFGVTYWTLDAECQWDPLTKTGTIVGEWRRQIGDVTQPLPIDFSLSQVNCRGITVAPF